METLFVFLNLQYNSKSFYVQAIYNWLLEIELFKTKKTTTTTTTTTTIQIALSLSYPNSYFYNKRCNMLL